MADNVNVTPSGTTPIATDEISPSGPHYQKVKLADGTAESEAAIAAGNGAAANALRVTVANDSTGVVAVTNAGLTTLAGAVSGSEMQVDVLTVPTLTVAKAIQWTNYSNEFTTAQTSQTLVAASGSNKIYVGSLRLATGYVLNATRVSVVIYFGTGAYSAGTSKLVWAGEFVTIPASGVESYPGVILGNGGAPFTISAASDALRMTTISSTHPKLYLSLDYVQAA